MHPDSLLFPRNQVSAQRRISIIAAFIGFFGVLVFNWQVAQVLYFYIWDVLFVGVSTIFRVTSAQGGRDKVLGRLLWALGFAAVYAGLVFLLISVYVGRLNLDVFNAHHNHVLVAICLLAANHIFGFLIGYLKNEVNKSATPFGQLFSTIFYILPTLVILFAFVFSSNLQFGTVQQNTMLATTLVNMRFALDMLLSYVQKRRYLYY